jgi:hypothetical protein
VSLHEYTRNDRSAFPQAALTESEKLMQGMERGAGALPMDTRWSTTPRACGRTCGNVPRP